MSVMSRIRNNLPLVAVVIAIAILAFTVSDFLNQFFSGSRAPEDAGVIAGRVISAQDFQTRYQNALASAKAQSPNGIIPDQQELQILDQTWNQLVTEIVYGDELDKVGLNVTGAELVDIFTGKNMSDFVKNKYQAAVEQNLQKPFNGASMKEFIQLIQDQGTPEYKQDLKEFEKALKEYTAQEHYRKMVKASYTSSSALARQRFIDNNHSADVSFMAVNYSAVPDSLIEVDDSDYKAFLKENAHRFKQEESTSIRFVRFDITPSAADTAEVKAEAERWKKTFASVPNDSTWTLRKSSVPFIPGQFAPMSDLPANVQENVLNMADKEVIGPFLEGDKFKLYKLVSSQVSEDDTWAQVKVATFPKGQTPEDSIKNREDALAGLRTARSQSMDSLSNAFDRGWYRKGSFGEDFDEQVANASVGSIIGPIADARGFHVVQVLNKTNKQFSVAQVERELFYSDKTLNEADDKAALFAAKAMDLNNIEAAASEEGIASYPSGALTGTSKSLTGLNEGVRKIILWALKSDVGAFSEIFKAGDSFVLAQVTEKRSEGTQSVDAVRASIATEVLNKKKAEFIISKIKGLSVNNDLAAMTTEYGTGAYTDTEAAVTFNGALNKIGQDPFIQGYIAGMEEGTVSPPLEGVNGVYVLQVTKKNGAEPTPEDLPTQKSADVISGTSAMEAKIDQGLREVIDIKDLRWKAGF